MANFINHHFYNLSIYFRFVFGFKEITNTIYLGARGPKSELILNYLYNKITQNTNI